MVSTERVANVSSEEILATEVPFEEYLTQFAGQHCEWEGGTVIKMSPISLQHNALLDYMYTLLAAYFELRPIGRVFHEPFTMRLPLLNKAREPDLFVALKTNPSILTSTYLDGPADICIDVVSPESVERDHGKKFQEYEKAVVKEYWILDPIHKESRFYRLGGDGGVYVRQETDEFGYYRTPLLPGLVLHIPTLWQDKLPGPIATVRAVEEMLKT